MFWIVYLVYLLINFNFKLIIEKDVQITIIPYKNWFTQTKYGIENWPDDVIFQDFSNIKNEEDRKKVLLALKNIKFVKLG